MPADLDATALVEAFRARSLSPLEALAASLARIAREDPVVNAFRLVDEDRARQAATASEARWAAGEPGGLLDGVPVGIKDVLLTRGWPTLRGSRTIDPAGPWEDDAPSVAALARNGAVAVGKTTTPEYGWKGVTDSPLDGITRNPWNPERTPGGSSGGSAAALAAGMVPLATGTDGGGSIRIPCGFCGLPGIKPTYGRVPAWPASPFGPLAHVGPMARTVRDVALMLDVMAEPDLRDWTALPPVGPLRGGEASVAGLRIAFSADLGYARVDPEVAALVARAAQRLEELGAHVERVDPGFADPRATFETLWFAGAARVVADIDADAVDPGLARTARKGAAIGGLDYIRALQARDALGLRMSEFHATWDLLVTPTLPIPAFEAGTDVPAGSDEEDWTSWTPFTFPFNVTQQPAGTVPCGFTADGLPVGLQVVGPRYGDALVLRAMAAYEAAHPEPTLATV
ncbi:MAG: aspartyl-tRNA(Asn)/glutamyl-tRNA(Gln) amidotransferase subunit [Solirubrobacteraceae bacterium]|nr:aspartyl-tRNA(Asn)/glutamyl-tRNA(Gln) amidotransferase subunit [Solirubrobacteraceae bacterium]